MEETLELFSLGAEEVGFFEEVPTLFLLDVEELGFFPGLEAADEAAGGFMDEVLSWAVEEDSSVALFSDSGAEET